ncbi:hypothetical protein GPX89_34035 [Nocardia sp. ET3-3]|uniref:Uncharacterized protein n=1 Tax=Nocardia terrae TaxID=2675851 RepID=A0A7K1V6H8_9NOCA|nr:hypothetical protein [Nocardia terrae]MVU82244.1 hypothetical protein [Nocardia terrae]
MSHTTTAQPPVRRVRHGVVWPDPSPLDAWWHSVMFSEADTTPRTTMTA